MSNPESQSDASSSSYFAAYIAPFALFLVLTQLETVESLKPHYPWVYLAKIVVVGASCVFFARQWPSWSNRGIVLGLVVGVVGLFVWVGLAHLGIEQKLVETVPALKTLFPDRMGFNPFQEITDPTTRIFFLVTRFIGLALVVPIIEEIFWRGFLMRYLIDDRRFDAVAIGTYTSLSFLLVTLLFALVHPEFIAAIAWGAGINLLLYQTRNLWATVVAHGVTNLLLGLYVLQYGDWRLW